jgi:hypothetical protein
LKSYPVEVIIQIDILEKYFTAKALQQSDIIVIINKTVFKDQVFISTVCINIK